MDRSQTPEPGAGGLVKAPRAGVRLTDIKRAQDKLL
jgi:hypothetical protein